MAQQRSQIPKFGNWEDEGNVPYTAYFDNARKDRIAKTNPEDNQDQEKTRVQRSPDVARPKHERRMSRDEGDLRKPSDSPGRNEYAGRRTSADSPNHRDSPRRLSRLSAGSDCSLEQSQLHPVKTGNRSGGVSSPLWERKGSSEGGHGLGSLTPGRSRLRSVTRGDDTPDHSPAVPKFGEWDESDPTSAEEYSQIFEKVREERHNEGGKASIIATENSYSYGTKRYANTESKGCGCFPWGRK